VIRYALRCACGHRFDAWFANAAAYDGQVERGLVSCPACGGGAVEKAPMAPAIGRGRRAPAPEPAPAPPAEPPAAEPDHRTAVRAALQAMVRRVKRGAEDVGPRFAEEARRIQAGEARDRPIWGRATGEDAKALREEGIAVHPLPDLPDNDA
jgi:hypothetical protein